MNASLAFNFSNYFLFLISGNWFLQLFKMTANLESKSKSGKPVPFGKCDKTTTSQKECEIREREATNKSKSFPYSQKILRYGLSKYHYDISDSILCEYFLETTNGRTFEHSPVTLCLSLPLTPFVVAMQFFFRSLRIALVFIICYLTFPIPIYNNLKIVSTHGSNKKKKEEERRREMEARASI